MFTFAIPLTLYNHSTNYGRRINAQLRKEGIYRIKYMYGLYPIEWTPSWGESIINLKEIMPMKHKKYGEHFKLDDIQMFENGEKSMA